MTTWSSPWRYEQGPGGDLAAGRGMTLYAPGAARMLQWEPRPTLAPQTVGHQGPGGRVGYCDGAAGTILGHPAGPAGRRCDRMIEVWGRSPGDAARRSVDPREVRSVLRCP